MDKNTDKLAALFAEVFSEDSLVKIIFPESAESHWNTAKLPCVRCKSAAD